MMRKLTVLVLIAAAAMAAVVALNVTGKWKVATTLPDGQVIAVVMDLEQDGAKLTGTLTTDAGDVVPLSDGKVDGEKVSFKVETDNGNWVVSATADGSTMKGTAKSPDGNDCPLTATKL